MWTAIAVLTVIYVGVVGYALASSQADTSALLWILVMVPSVFAAGVVILWKRPDHRIGRLLTLAAITMFVIPTILEVVTVVRFEMGGEEPWMWAPMCLTTTLSAVGTVLLCAILVTIPDGEYRHNRERLLIRWSWLLVILPTLSLISNPFVVTFDQVYIGMDEIDSPYVIEPLESLGPLILDVTSLAFVLVFLAAVWFQILRYRQAATRERKQVRWVLFGGGMALLLGLIPFALGALGVTPTLTHGMVANAVFSAIPIILIPASIVVCVLEPKWVDVDIVIRRSFVYGALSFVILLLYVGVAAALGLAAGANLQIEIAIFLTVLVAILFQPARRWLQQLADRWVFGERPSKYEAVTEFGASLDEHSDPAELLPRLSDTLQRTLDVTWIEIVVEEGKAAAAGDSRGEPALVAPITDGVEELGEIRCGPRRKASDRTQHPRRSATGAGRPGRTARNGQVTGRERRRHTRRAGSASGRSTANPPRSAGARPGNPPLCSDGRRSPRSSRGTLFAPANRHHHRSLTRPEERALRRRRRGGFLLLRHRESRQRAQAQRSIGSRRFHRQVEQHARYRSFRQRSRVRPGEIGWLGLGRSARPHLGARRSDASDQRPRRNQSRSHDAGAMIRVVIAEDHYLVREGTRRLLESADDVEVVQTVGDLEGLLAAVHEENPDAVITDIRMPPEHQTEGIEAAHAIRSANPEVGVVVLSQYVNSLYAFELFKEGTSGLAYLLKDRVGDLDEILRAVREVTAGGSVIDPQVVEGLLARRQNLTNSLLDTLTERERDVLAEMAQGKSNAGIAETLFISQSAVEKHINSIFSKLTLSPDETDVHRRVAAVLAFLRNQELPAATEL